MSKVGFIGVGTMGCPMASNIVSKGNDLNFYDPYVQENNKTKLLNLGAKHCLSIKDLVQDRDFVITMLPNGTNVKDVCFNNDSLLQQEQKNYIFIDMSTILPSDSININEEFKSNNIFMFDAPVARLVNNAIDGTLLIMVGGDKEKFDTIKPLLETMGSDVIYCGSNGSGSKMKIINNYMSIVSNIVTAESLSLVHKSGIDLNLAINLLTTTAAGKGHLNTSYPMKVLNNDIAPGFKNTLALKDLKLALEQGEIDGIDLRTGKSALKNYEDADKTKYKDLDWTSMFNYIKEINNLD
ncbi:MAG: NAD-binding protein [Pelagibacteraceae bacterium]|nr:NAD-binding protein [Pelagibacteraceae bacterium]MBT3902393.1 NAD-binding protein [Pelagibacteraceae bacterium]MBT4646238.1 NAD-binding protein [Pelagibacteraceae bacterium]MBT4951499.1 NAD-binding protein [Pelagibacteraceae bacterium]MBT5214814.1 NAD-binding protein [Pelagibacteraceae bacterium]